MEKTFGRAYDNTIVINKPDISSHHARITFLGNGNFLVEDLDSTNGVYVNGYRIQKANVTTRDEVRLSEATVLNLAAIFELNAPKQPQQAKTEPKDFSFEFAELKQVWEEYNRVKIQVSKNYQKKANMFQIVAGFLPVGIWLLVKEIYINQFKEDHDRYNEWMSYMMVFTATGSALGVALRSFFIQPPQEKLNNLDEEFRVRYVCPNPECRTQLGNIPWQSYINQGKCFRCQAKYT
jgi:hypothetical protein